MKHILVTYKTYKKHFFPLGCFIVIQLCIITETFLLWNQTPSSATPWLLTLTFLISACASCIMLWGWNRYQQLEKSLHEAQTIISKAEGNYEIATQAKNNFLSTLGHEIRTPLNGVLGMTGLLNDTKLNNTQQNYLKAIRDSGEHLLHVLNDMLDFSMLTEGLMELEITEFNLTRTVESVSEMMASSAHAKHIEISTYISPQIPQFLHGDVSRLRQILNIIVGNAIKFTPNGAVMTEVFVENQSPHLVVLRFQVSDTGIGIDPSIRHKLFEHFNQGDNSRTRRYNGTGLGLAICKELVNTMEGNLSFESEINEGSTFYFTIPMLKPKITHNQKDLPSQTIPHFSGARALVVDDHNFNRHIFKRQLEKMDMSVTTTEDGPTAIQALEQSKRDNMPFSVAIIDHIMPNMDGEELAEYIRIQPEFKDLKLILASSKNISAADPRLKALGFNYTLIKPVREDTLQRSLIKIMEGKTIAENNSPPKHIKDYAGLRILLAEDNTTNQYFIQQLLLRYFKTVEVACNGIEAIALAEKFPFDLILMDVSMPSMDGIEASKIIIENIGAKNTPPILGMSNDLNQKEQETCLNAGMDNIISKQLEGNALLKEIIKHAPIKRINNKKGKSKNAI